MVTRTDDKAVHHGEDQIKSQSDLAKQLAQVNGYLREMAQLVNNEKPITDQVKAHLLKNGYQVGIDLGTADVQTVVVDGQGKPIATFLDWTDVVKDGVVVDYFGACQIIRSQIEKVEAKLGIKITKAVTSYPPGTDPRISINVVQSAGIDVSNVVDEPASVAFLLNIKEGAVVDVGGGTTGTAIIEQGQLMASFDEATGGHHVSLTIAGGLKISLEEAELKKKSAHDRKLLGNMVKPVIENMASIVARHIKDYHPKSLYLTGGGCLIDGFAETFKQMFPDLDIIEFEYALYLTPLAIASYDLPSN